ncbi:MAG: cytochrome C oxidase subunit IV family protein [Bacteroidia bacterium]
MSEFHDDYPQYELMAHHSEEEGKKGRRTLWNVFWVMLAITIFELIIGSMAPGHGWSGHLWLKVLFISLTVVKAAAIVMWFMHLGHEVSFFKYIVLIPYITFMCYCIFICLNEGSYSGKVDNRPNFDKLIVQQQIDLKAHKGEHSGGEGHEASAEQGSEHH